ncbi:MAG: hypothetical protein K6C95_05455 [Lachnospiraceae bacterium]|nr:hypothetical protein [Lachnospiraceae bacterium]
MLRSYGNDGVNGVLFDANCAFIDKQKIYFFPQTSNKLYSMDLNNHRVEYLGKIPWEDEDGIRLIESLIMVENRLYMIPFAGRYLTSYDMRSKEFDKIDIRNNGKLKGSFGSVFSDHELLFIFGQTANVILEYNTKTGKIKSYSDWVTEIKEIAFNINDAYFRNQGVKCEDYYLIPLCNANALLLFDYNKKSFRIVRLGSDANGYSGATRINDSIWLAPRIGGMYAIECDLDFKIKRRVLPDAQLFSEAWFSGVTSRKGRPTIISSSAKTNKKEFIIDEIGYMNHASLLFCDDVFRVYYDDLEKQIRIETDDEILYDDTIKASIDELAACGWISDTRKGIVMLENKQENLSLLVDMAKHFGEETNYE